MKYFEQSPMKMETLEVLGLGTQASRWDCSLLGVGTPVFLKLAPQERSVRTGLAMGMTEAVRLLETVSVHSVAVARMKRRQSFNLMII